jgi:uncharacterized protein (TIGR03437 family)
MIYMRHMVLFALACTLGGTGMAQFAQDGEKLVGTGAMPLLNWQGQGSSVAVSADGNTAIVGGPNDDGRVGAAWVFRRVFGVWIQQGTRLVGSGPVGSASQGSSVALSADGNTAIVGGPGDNGGRGAAWVFTRSGGVWRQEGSKLVGTGAWPWASQGYSVALSADGNTAIVGGPRDDICVGAAWVFTRWGGVWRQEGSKLVGSSTVGCAKQGNSVALSADGNTAIVGGPDDNANTGAAWVFTRSAGLWTQQGSKLVGSGAFGFALQGCSVALSADGNTAIVGGPWDKGSLGATWVFSRSAGLWTQQGSKLVGSGAVGAPFQGYSVALSADGNTAIVGGPRDNSDVGAAWVFTRSAGVWTQQGSKLVGSGAARSAHQGYSVALSADGNTAIMGGPDDGMYQGAAWVFRYTPPPVIALSENQLSFSFVLGGNAPPAQAVTVTNAGRGTLSWTATSNAGWLRVSPGSGSGPTTLVVSVNPLGLGVGAFNGVITVSSPGLASQTIAVTLRVSAPVPVISAVVNAASFQSGMVPGGLATLFGKNLSWIAGTEFPGGASLYKGVSVTVEGRQAPLLAVSNVAGREQINFQVPFELGVPAMARVEVDNNGSVATIRNVPLLRAQPGIFEWTPPGSTTTYAAAVKVDGSVAGPANPVPRGEAVSIFLTGMGPVLPILRTGEIGPAYPPAVTWLQPWVGVGGLQAPVLFSGYAPGFLGLYQVNIVVPGVVPTGAVSLDVVVDGVPSQTSKIAVQ